MQGNSIDNLDAGTLNYMSPESISGKLKSLSPAVDIWAMGIILYYMLVGSFPFKGEST